MRVFDDFDLEEKTNPDTRINLPEKTMILAFRVAVKRALRKASKARTYGELYDIMNSIELKMDKMEKKYGMENGDKAIPKTEAEFNTFVKELEEIGG